MIIASNIIFSGVVKQKYTTTPVLAYKAAKKAYNQHVGDQCDQDTAIDTENDNGMLLLRAASSSTAQ